MSDPAHTLMPLLAGSSSQEGSPTKSRELSLSSDKLEEQRARQDRCEELMLFQKKTFEAIVQLAAIEECLRIFSDITESTLLDRSTTLNEYWSEILQNFIAALEAAPPSMLHVHVRDMRYTVAGLLDEAYREDPLEFCLVYDLSYSGASSKEDNHVLST